MLSGIWNLEWKCVKNASQRFWVLFIGARKPPNWHAICAKNGWEKPHTPFVEVVEGYEIYNFPIIHLVHFSWKSWRKTQSKGASRNGFSPGRPERAPSACATRAAILPGPHTEASFGLLVHVPWAALAEQPFRSYPLAPRVAHARVGCADRAARPMPLPPYCGHATAHTAACCLGAQEDLPTALSLAIKAGHRPSRAGAQCCQAAIAAVLVPRWTPGSGRFHRKHVLLLPPLGLPVAPTLVGCLGWAAGSPESDLQWPPPPASAAPGRWPCPRRKWAPRPSPLNP
jgi:hypothetical protein